MGRNGTKAIAAAVIVGLSIGGGVAWASVPGPDGVIHGCYKASDGGDGGNKGSLRVVDVATDCKKSERTLDWNQTGPQGPQGPQGIQGVQGTQGDNGIQGVQGVKGDRGDPGTPGSPGAQGPQGPAGASDVYIRRGGSVEKPDGNANSHTTLQVPAGNYLISGKAVIVNGDGSNQPADCHLSTGDKTYVEVPQTRNDGGTTKDGWLAVSVMDTTSVSTWTPIWMDCHVFGGWIYNMVLTATQVGAIHTQV